MGELTRLGTQVKRLGGPAFDLIAGNRVAESVMRRRTNATLRVLAYHGVDHPERFHQQMEHVRTKYHPVSVDSVLSALDGAPLPDRAIWVTFDDGDPTVVESGLDVTQRLEIPITLFLCPSVIDSTTSLWWQSVESSVAAGVRPSRFAGTADQIVSALKSLPDGERRAIVADLARAAATAGLPPRRGQLDTPAMRRLELAGATVGNHTWDHPTLDTCEPEEQLSQIARADSALRHWPQLFRPVFAYPNGNWTAHAEEAAQALGYRIGLLFDHQLTDRTQPPLRWSRLRVGSATPLGRFRAILSGAHSGLTRLRHRWT